MQSAVRIVDVRGRAMQACADAEPGGMVAVLGLERDRVEEVCDGSRGTDVLSIANVLCPGNIVVSGGRAACERVAEEATKAGAMKCVPLEVAGAFHTKLMEPAKDKLAAVLEETELRVPRIPVMYRWAERYARMRQAGIEGVHTAWRFYGFCAQRNDEIVDHFAWEENPNSEKLLKTIARRDFGERASSKVLSAWRSFSRAFEYFPYSAGITGLPYFRGPFYIGPAHPFIFDPNVPAILPYSFYSIDPSRMELSSDPEILNQYKRPTFFVDLIWTQPFGPQRTRKSLQDLKRGWEKGICALSEALAYAKGTEKARVQEELDLATGISCMIRTAYNLLQFQILRDEIVSQAVTKLTLSRKLAKIQKILSNEIENANVAMILAKRNPSLGFGSAYGTAFNAEMIQAKIRDTQKQRDVIIPEFENNLRFHLFGL